MTHPASHGLRPPRATLPVTDPAGPVERADATPLDGADERILDEDTHVRLDAVQADVAEIRQLLAADGAR